MLTRYQDRAAGTQGFGTPVRTRLRSNRTALQDLTGSEHQIEHAYEVLGRDAGSHGFGTPDRTCLRGIRTGLQDLTGLEQRFQHAYEVSGRGCRTCQVGAAGSHRLGTGDRTYLRSIRTGLQGLTGSANQIRLGLQDLTDKEQQFKHAYEELQWGCRISRVRISDRTCLRGIRVGLQALTGKEQQFQHAYEVSGRGCRISRVGNIRSNMPTMCQVGAAGFHGLGTTDRTCLLGIRRGLQDLTGSKHQIERA